MNMHDDKMIELSAADLRFARWNDLPDIDLYLDQVVTFVNRQLEFFVPAAITAEETGNDKKNKENILLSPSMVNNYVKLKILPPPQKKRYNRTHLAQLIMLTLFKQVFSINDIYRGFLTVENVEENGFADHYDRFCDEMEHTIDIVLRQMSGDTIVIEPYAAAKSDKVMLHLRAACFALACKVVAEHFINIKIK